MSLRPDERHFYLCSCICMCAIMPALYYVCKDLYCWYLKSDVKIHLTQKRSVFDAFEVLYLEILDVTCQQDIRRFHT